MVSYGSKIFIAAGLLFRADASITQASDPVQDPAQKPNVNHTNQTRKIKQHFRDYFGQIAFFSMFVFKVPDESSSRTMYPGVSQHVARPNDAKIRFEEDRITFFYTRQTIFEIHFTFLK